MTDPMKHRLLFKNPVFHDGVNATVRFGLKWHFRAPADSIVEVWQTDGDYLFDALIIESQAMRICDIPPDLLEHEHDPNCRTPYGLIAELERVYRKKISSRDKVTVLTFERYDG